MAGDWIFAAHVLLPEIGSSVRSLLLLAGGSGVSANAQTGGFEFLTLDQLLGDARIVEVLTPDFVG